MRFLPLALAAALPLGGCGVSYWRALSFQGDRERTAVEGSYAAYWVSPGDAAPLASSVATPEGRTRAQRQCSAAFAGLTGGARVADPATLTGIVAGYAVGAGIDLLVDYLKSRAERLEKESKRSEVVNINIPRFDFRGLPNQTTCIYLERTAKVGQREESVFRFAAVVQRVGDLMYAWAPTGATMSHGLALSEKDKPIRVDVAIATTTAVERDGRPAAVSMGPSTFTFDLTPNGDAENPDLAHPRGPAPAMPLPTSRPLGPQAATISIAITETGSGSSLFQDAFAAAEDNLKALRTFGIDYATAYGRAGRLGNRD